MQAVILAAGRSSRFWPLNKKHKSLISILGRPLIFYTIESLRKSGVKDIIIVQGPKKDIQAALKEFNLKVRYVTQNKPLGTGDALWRARNFIRDPFVLIGAHKIDGENYLGRLLEKFKKNKGKIVFLASKTDRPWEFGILDFKESGKILRVVENPKKGREPSKIKTNEVYLIPPNFLNYCKKVPLTEDSLIKAFNLFIKKEGAKAVVLKEETISLKYPWETLKALNFLLKSKHLKRKILSKSLGKNVILEGKVYIGKNVQIRENTVIKGPCYIGDNCQIGSNNLVRGSVNLEKGVVTGSFAEIKNSLFQENSHIHSGYFGNLILGRNCRFGAGFISANRRLDREEIKSMVKGKKIGTGLTYFGGVIGDNSYFGIRVSLMPGVLVGSGCKIGPNSLILENIPDKTTFYNKFYKG